MRPLFLGINPDRIGEEGRCFHPPAHLIEPLAKALNVSTDELLGIKAVKQQRNPEHAALWRRLKKIETLSMKDQKALLHYLDALVKKNEGNGKNV